MKCPSAAAGPYDDDAENDGRETVGCGLSETPESVTGINRQTPLNEVAMKHNFTAGSRVEFDSDHGFQTGTIIGIQKDIGNGQGHAVVEVDHALPGCTWKVPLDALQPEKVEAAA